MRLGYSGGVMPTASVDDDLSLAARTGYAGVELWVPKLWGYLERHGLAALRSLLRRHRTPAWSLAPIRDVTFRDRIGFEEVSATVHRLSEVGRHVGAPWLVLWPGDQPDGTDERDALADARETFARLCRISERYDVGLALMPLGLSRASIRTIRQGGAVVESVARRSVALALDTFHFQASGSSLEDLQHAEPRWIVFLRIADAQDRPREELREHHRVPPGDGVIPLRAITSLLQRLGANPPAVISVPFHGSSDDAEVWALRMRERTLAACSDLVATRP